MFNLRYQRNGQIIKLGDTSKPFVAACEHAKFKWKPKVKKFQLIPKLTKDLYLVPMVDRLGYLKRLSNMGSFITKSRQGKVRANFEKIKKNLLDLNKVVCYACGGRAEHRHHVIPISRGGDNVQKNLVPLCNTCHEAVHPWLNEVPDRHQRKIADGASDSGEVGSASFKSPCYASTRSITSAE